MEEKNYKEKLKDITTFIFDVDGVFTNTQVFVNNDGDLLRSMNMKDGFALKTVVCVFLHDTTRYFRYFATHRAKLEETYRTPERIFYGRLPRFR